MWEDMGLDQQFPGLRCKVMSNFVETDQDRVALFDFRRYVLLPGLGLV